jgi:hypothetical protein
MLRQPWSVAHACRNARDFPIPCSSLLITWAGGF